MLCPKNESQEEEDSQDGSSVMPVRKAVSNLGG